MYKLLPKQITPFGEVESKVVQRLSDNAFIPFDPANTDYEKFKSDVLAGEQLQDADGNPMTQQQTDDFIKELP
jgi:hypothetical protein